MNNTKYPFMVEFSGTPEAGKTTCIKNLLVRFDNEKINVGYIRESAETVNPLIPKGSFHSHLSMKFHTLNKIIEAKYSNFDLLLIDRGIIDSIFFTIKHSINNPSVYSECATVIIMLNQLTDFFPDFLFLFTTSPETSIQRRGGEGRIVTLDFLQNYNRLLNVFEQQLEVPHVMLDTSCLSKDDIVNKAYNLIMNKYLSSG